MSQDRKQTHSWAVLLLLLLLLLVVALLLILKTKIKNLPLLVMTRPPPLRPMCDRSLGKLNNIKK
jgi:hypothetical protein